MGCGDGVLTSAPQIPGNFQLCVAHPCCHAGGIEQVGTQRWEWITEVYRTPITKEPANAKQTQLQKVRGPQGTCCWVAKDEIISVGIDKMTGRGPQEPLHTNIQGTK